MGDAHETFFQPCPINALNELEARAFPARLNRTPLSVISFEGNKLGISSETVLEDGRRHGGRISAGIH